MLHCVLLILYKSPIEFRKGIIIIFLFFGLAKLSEKFDREIYNLLSNTISGHSLKHLFMVIAGYEIVAMMRLNAAEYIDFKSLKH